MKLVFIHGPAAAGKLTVGRALQELSGFRLFHNHLVVDALLSTFPFGSEPFVRLREQMWLSVFGEAARYGTSLIFTFAPESTVDPAFISRTVEIVTRADGLVHFVELVCPIEELERRIENPSRAEFMKLRSVETFRQLRDASGWSFPRIQKDVTIDTSIKAPAEAAREICAAFQIPVLVRPGEFQPYPPDGR